MWQILSPNLSPKTACTILDSVVNLANILRSSCEIDEKNALLITITVRFLCQLINRQILSIASRAVALNLQRASFCLRKSTIEISLHPDRSYCVLCENDNGGLEDFSA